LLPAVASAELEVRSDDDFARMRLLEVLIVLELLSSEKNARRKDVALSFNTIGDSLNTTPAHDLAVVESLLLPVSVSEKEHVTSSTAVSAKTDLLSEK